MGWSSRVLLAFLLENFVLWLAQPLWALITTTFGAAVLTTLAAWYSAIEWPWLVVLAGVVYIVSLGAIFLTALFFTWLRRMLGRPNINEWDLTDPLTIEEASYLWCDLSPHLAQAKLTNPRQHWLFRTLKRWADGGNMAVQNGRIPADKWTTVNRTELRRIAEHLKERPQFLFPDSR